MGLLDYAGYRVIQLKPFIPLFRLDSLTARLSRVNRSEIILFFRQLALLLESGISVVTSLELLHSQAINRAMKRVLQEAIADLRAGNQLSTALGKHPEVFSQLCQRSLKVGEQTGNMETILRQMADYMEKDLSNTKSLKSALSMPLITFVFAAVVSLVLATFVLPTFAKLYSSLGVELPLITRIFLKVATIFKQLGPFILVAFLAGIIGGYAYIKTPEGKYRSDGLILRLPLLGSLMHFNELARCARSIALLYGAGLPLTEIMPLAVKASGNTVVARALSEVHQDMLKGEGLSHPMSKNRLFLPLMVQMVKVGEETGNLDATLLSVAKTYEADVEEKTRSLISMVQPVMTIAIGLIIGLIALSLTSAMYSLYGQS